MATDVRRWEFRKGLSEPFIKALNGCWENGGWWRKIVDDKDLILGIRDESLNVYYRGASLMRIDFRDARLGVHTHYKYLVRSPEKGAYVGFRLDSSGQLVPAIDAQILQGSPNDLDQLKSNAKAHTGDEKNGVHKIAISNAVNIIDLEVALLAVGGDVTDVPDVSVDENDDDRDTVDRIDIAAIDLKTGHPRLAFYEAKHFSNKELRSSRGVPPVFEQLARYEDDLVHYRDQLESTYRRVASNFLALEGVGRVSGARRELLEATARQLEVLTKPRLLVFGFDDDQKRGGGWGRHKANLQGHFKERFLHRGDPSGFALSPGE